MQPPSTTAFSDVLDFDAETVYRRTADGQRELTTGVDRLSRSEQCFLAVVTGFTPLRVFMDMTSPPDAPTALRRLVEHGLIERVTPASRRNQ